MATRQPSRAQRPPLAKCQVPLMYAMVDSRKRNVPSHSLRLALRLRSLSERYAGGL